MNDTTKQMLASSQNVLIYPPELAEKAGETMESLLSELVTTLAVTDPELNSLVVVDSNDHDGGWDEKYSHIQVTTPQEIIEGTFHLHKSQTIVAMTADFLRIRIAERFTRSTRFYVACATDTPVSLIAKVAPLRKAVFL